MPHVGGVLSQPGEPYYEMIEMWIAEGVKLDLYAPRVASLEVLPQDRNRAPLGQKQQMVVMATYTDGSVRDVTAEAFIDSSNTEVATVDKQGLVDGRSPRRSDHAGPLRRGLRRQHAYRHGRPHRLRLEATSGSSTTSTTLVYEKLKKVKVLPSDSAPTPSSSAASPRPDRPAAGARGGSRVSCRSRGPTRVKRDELVDKLIGSPKLHRTLDEQVGRPASSEPQVPGRQGRRGVARLHSQRRRRQHALRQVRLQRS